MIAYLKLANTFLKEDGGQSNPCSRAVIDDILFAFRFFSFVNSTVALIQRLYFSDVFTYLRRPSFFCFELTTCFFQPLSKSIFSTNNDFARNNEPFSKLSVSHWCLKNTPLQQILDVVLSKP